MSSFLEVRAGPSVPGQCWTRGEELSNRWEARKFHLLSRKLTEEHLLVCKLGGDCISGFSQWPVVRTLTPGPNFAPRSPYLELGLGLLPGPSQLHTSSLGEAQILDGCEWGRRSE